MVAPSKHQPSSSDRAGPAAARQLLVGSVVLAVVALLTLMFSFLGTISSAALVGMMFGTIRQSRWQVVVISFVFPLVSLAFSRVLVPERNLLLASLCFGVFWSTYLLTCGAVYLEKSQSPGSVSDPADPAEINPPVETGKPEPAYDPNLNELQGKWDRQGAALDRRPSVESIELTRDRLLVRVSDAEGKLRTACCGRVQVKRVGAYKVAVVLEAGPNSEDVPSRFIATTWLYKVNGQTLTIAWNFHNTRQDPLVENYQKEPAALNPHSEVEGAPYR